MLRILKSVVSIQASFVDEGSTTVRGAPFARVERQSTPSVRSELKYRETGGIKEKEKRSIR